MENLPIEGFGTKLMVASKSINKIPSYFLKTAQNVRIFDGGIGPRRGKELLLSSSLGTNNKGGFMMNSKLYQVANSKIYEINLDTGVQTEKATLSYNARVDILVYKEFAIIVSNKQDLEVFNGEGLETTPTTVPFANTGIIEYTRGYSFLAGGSGLQLEIDQLIDTNSFYFGILLSSVYREEGPTQAYGEYLKQSITLTDSVDSLSVTLKMAKVGTVTDNVEVGIYRTSDDVQVGTTQTIVGDTLKTTASDTLFSFNSVFSLTTSEAYYIKINRSGSLVAAGYGNSNYYCINGSYVDIYGGGDNNIFQYNSVEETTLISSLDIVLGDGDYIKQTFTLDEAITNPIVRLKIDNNSANDDLSIGIYRTSDDVLITDEITHSSSSIFTWDSIIFTGSLTLTTSEAYYIKILSLATFGSYNIKDGETYTRGQSFYGNTPLTTSLQFSIIFETQEFIKNGDLYFLLDGVFTTPGVTGSLFVSRPITSDNPEYAYDFTGEGSQDITYDDTIIGLKGTMNGLYILTQKKVEFLGANSLQNVAGSATFISTPLGRSGEPVNNHCIVASGDKIFFITKSLQIQTVNYISGTESASIGTLSSIPIVGIKELLNTIDDLQPNAFGFYNKKDETIQFHVRTTGSNINDVCIIYDLTNDTFSTDTNKEYNYVVENGQNYYGFSDTNTSIYNDDVGSDDNGVAINSIVKTQKINQGTILGKMYGGFFSSGGVGYLTELEYNIYIDEVLVFTDTITGSVDNDLLEVFDKLADEGRIYMQGQKIEIEISSESLNQNYILDVLGIRAAITNNLDIKNKF